MIWEYCTRHSIDTRFAWVQKNKNAVGHLGARWQPSLTLIRGHPLSIWTDLACFLGYGDHEHRLGCAITDKNDGDIFSCSDLVAGTSEVVPWHSRTP